MNDDQMDEMLIDGVRDYNEPGAVPRDEMWNRIAAARAANRAAAQVSPAAAVPPRSRMWVWPSVGIAAALLLSVGIVIGRRMDRSSTPDVVTASSAPAAATPGVVKSQNDTSIATAKPDSVIDQLRQETKKTGQRVRALASAPAAAAAASPRNSRTVTGSPTDVPANASQSLAYRLVVLQHLAGSEALITSFRTVARNGVIDAQLATWSRELLNTTRLLESSQAAADPVMKRLLEDLDLVISQIVQYTTRGTTNSEELDLIEQSINKRGVMTKLRSNIPSRTTAGT